MKENPNIGSDFDNFLKEEGILEEVEASALLKNYLAIGAKLKTTLLLFSKVEDKEHYTHEEVFSKLRYAETHEQLLVESSCLSIELADLLVSFLPDGGNNE